MEKTSLEGEQLEGEQLEGWNVNCASEISANVFLTDRFAPICQLISTARNIKMGFTDVRLRLRTDKRVTEDFRSVDVRWMKRKGVLVAGTAHRIQRSESGQFREVMKVHALKQSLIVRLPYQNGNKQTCSIALEWTNCNLGGSRPWFRCPSPFCNQRVAILYIAKHIRCRKCLGLIYATQNEGRIARVARRADQIRVQLGWSDGILDGPDRGKPKNMHWKKYNRLNQEFTDIHNKLMAALIP